ncbi:ABC transporter ATP-binding protein [Thermosulfurimonas dismutans]|uniref:Vitamin B12 ABC transporter, ATPase component BtuD n=1 Tax=Thermosulfurimonas dismutans TaxID=999894 RepID=A0A179D2N3_9BACT|nr:ABC transporter ATP-binding protein [Thermosulfurimonas dismutans]OAQ20051.1 Vitamin B12 ABC transporter, ATPase component BtuD [Thermosulfurimonas dismutans]
MLEVRDLSFAQILQEVNLTLHKGEFVVLLGPNGAGKTTLLKCLLGLYTPTRGEVLVCGRPLKHLTYKERARLLAYVPQSYHPVFPYTVLEFVLLGRTPHLGFLSRPGKRDEIKAREVLRSLGLEALVRRRLTDLSGGERQLVLFARALLQEAPIFLLDEPTANLDLKHQIEVLTTVHRLAGERGLTVVATLHDPNLAFGFADRVVLIKKGRILAEMNPRKHPRAQELLEELYEIPLEILYFRGYPLVSLTGAFPGNPLGGENHENRGHFMG